MLGGKEIIAYHHKPGLVHDMAFVVRAAWLALSWTIHDYSFWTPRAAKLLIIALSWNQIREIKEKLHLHSVFMHMHVKMASNPFEN